MCKFTIKEILDVIWNEIIEVKGNINFDIKIDSIKSIEEVDPNSLDWISKRNANKQLIAETSKAKVIICDKDIEYNETLINQKKVLLCVSNPKLAIALVGNKLFLNRPQPNIHQSAIIDKDAEIGKNVFIGPNCNIGKCKIKDNCTIYSGVNIYDNVEIEKNTLIHSGAVIGTDGLGCEKLLDGTLIKFPHLGGVRIGSNVEIGANSNISRGALSNTIISDGTKINGLCFIAHNVFIGKNVLITGQVMICGSVRIEDSVTISPGVTIREKVKIGTNSHIGLGAVVVNNIPENELWIGVPAKFYKKLDRNDNK